MRNGLYLQVRIWFVFRCLGQLRGGDSEMSVLGVGGNMQENGEAEIFY